MANLQSSRLHRLEENLPAYIPTAVPDGLLSAEQILQNNAKFHRDPSINFDIRSAIQFLPEGSKVSVQVFIPSPDRGRASNIFNELGVVTGFSTKNGGIAVYIESAEGPFGLHLSPTKYSKGSNVAVLEVSKEGNSVTMNSNSNFSHERFKINKILP